MERLILVSSKRWYDDNGILNISVIDFLLDDTLV